jgi:predicted RNA-binding Zn ribbon-like protein
VGQPHGYRWVWKVPEGTLESLLGTIALSASELLLSQDRSRVGQCADEDGCGWLFLDTSKNHSRRWCDVRDCGNRARQRQFQKRARRKAK